jgi:Flp pilus assembly protein TadG
MAIARSQCQNAADAAATAGARTLNGDSSSNNNAASVAQNAYDAAEANTILQNTITDSQVTVWIGTYTYNSSTQSFPTAPFTGLTQVTKGVSPPTNASDNWSLAQAQVTHTGSYLFGKVFGLANYSISATATAAHRPMDVAITLDYSGSMRFGCLPGVPAFDTRDTTGASNSLNSGSNNPDSIYPTFGAYSLTATAALQNTTDLTIFGNQYGVSNITTTTSDGRPPIVSDFYSDSSGTVAFSSAGSDGGYNYAATNPGDKYLFYKNSTTNFAQEVEDIVGGTSKDATWESTGYAGKNGQFYGYTQGPNYWGKTFFIWPPDPTTNSSTGISNDWRVKFFGTNDNTKLWRSSGSWKDPHSGGYTVNYDRILSWIKNTGPNPFPSQLQSGRIVYYTSIPDHIDTSTFPPTDLNQRF